MSTKPQARMPRRYKIKLAIEIVMLSLLLLASSTSYYWIASVSMLGHLILIVLQFLVFLFGLSLFLRLLAIIYRRQKHLPFDEKDNVTTGLTNIFGVIIGVFALISLFRLFGVDFRNLFTSLSIGAAAIAIILKDFIADIISGIIISFSRDLSIGDYVKIGDNRGKIMAINISKTAILNEDDDIIYIPNSKVFMSETVNYTKKQIKKTSIDFEVSIKHVKSIEELETLLIQSLSEYHHLIEPHSFFLRVLYIRKDHLVLKFQYNLIDFSHDLERRIKRKAVRHIVQNITSRN